MAERSEAGEIRALRDLDLADFYWRDFPPPVPWDASIHVHGRARDLALGRLQDRHHGLRGVTIPHTAYAGALMLEVEQMREEVQRLAERVARDLTPVAPLG